LAAVVSFAKGCVHRLRAGDLRPEELREKLDQIAEEALRAGSIIRWVQRFLRKEAPRREPTDIRGLIANIVRLVETEARQRGIEIRVRIAAEVPVIPVEAVQVEQVLFNLVRNGFDALDARSGDGAEVEIEAAVDGENVEVSVRDTGPGLGPGDPERIFEPFYSSKSGGMGLGLSISRSIVEAHGGHLRLGETGGNGTTFRFSLPISPPGDE
jgi:two-component system sensor histidine kinase TtrS